MPKSRGSSISGDDPNDSPVGSPGGVDLDSSKESLTSYSHERRRSERVKREKPDYYDALDFEHKRTKSPGRGRRGEKTPWTPGRSPKVEARGRGRGQGASSSSATGRACLTWKKGTEEDEDDRERRRRKRPRHRETENEDFMMEELSSEKILQCRVSLAEINKKLGTVMVQPS